MGLEGVLVGENAQESTMVACAELMVTGPEDMQRKRDRLIFKCGSRWVVMKDHGECQDRRIQR